MTNVVSINKPKIKKYTKNIGDLVLHVIEVTGPQGCGKTSYIKKRQAHLKGLGAAYRTIEKGVTSLEGLLQSIENEDPDKSLTLLLDDYTLDAFIMDNSVPINLHVLNGDKT